MARFGQTPSNFQSIVMVRDGAYEVAYTPQDYVFLEFMGYTRTDGVTTQPGGNTGGGTGGGDGREVMLENDGTNIRWRYSGTTAWTNLVSLANLRGPSGRNPEFRSTAQYLQWRLEGDAIWQNLVALADITGPAGTGGTGGGTTTPTTPATVVFTQDATGAIVFDTGAPGHPTLDTDGALVYDLSLGNPTQDADGSLVFTTS